MLQIFPLLYPVFPRSDRLLDFEEIIRISGGYGAGETFLHALTAIADGGIPQQGANATIAGHFPFGIG